MRRKKQATSKALAPTGLTPPRAVATWGAATAGGDVHRSPRRQCIICRRAGPCAQLMQLAAAKLPRAPRPYGRRAYVCISLACLSQLAQRGWACRAGDVASGLSPVELCAELARVAAARVHEALGLARRQGLAVLGAGRLAAPGAPACPLAVTAADAADNTLVQLAQAGCGGVAAPFLNQVTLGGAVGAAPLAAVGIAAPRLAHQAAYWLRVWYEAQAKAVPSALEKTLGHAVYSTRRI